MTTPSFLQRQPIHERRLDNGLTVLVREDHSSPVVAVVTHVRAGYFDEPDHLVGISHVLEHMYFKGTERRGVGEIARATKDAGGYLNAGTIYDRTSYYTVLPANGLEQALDIQADALQRSALDAEELRKELLVIIQEARRKLDNPPAVAMEKLFEAMFDVHRMRRWRIGSEDMLRGFTRADVYAFYRTHYVASNTVLVIAGDVSPEPAFELVERHYGAMPAGAPVVDPAPEEPVRRQFRYREIDGDIAQCHAQWGWRVPGTLHPDTPLLDVLSVALGQGRASPLYRLVRDAGLVTSISAFNYTPTSIGVFGLAAELVAADVPRAFLRMAEVIASIRAHGLADIDVERARNLLEARMLRRLETADGQATLLAGWQALGDWRLAEKYLEQVLAATTDRVNHVAHRYLDPDTLTVLLYRPRRAPAFAGSAAEAERAIFGSIGSPAPLTPPARGVAVRTPRVARLEPELVQDGVRSYLTGDGNARIIVKPRTTAPLVSMALHCRGGSIHERAAVAGITGLMARTSVKGTRRRSADALAMHTEALGASIAPGVSADTLDWTISVPAHHFDTGLALLLDAALSPTFPEQEAERERVITLRDLQQVRDDMYQYPLRLALSAAFDGHAYGFSLETLESAVGSLDLGALSNWHATRVLAGMPHVLIVGDVSDPDRAAAQVAAHLAGMLHRPNRDELRAPGWPERPVQQVAELERAQTALALAFPGPPRNHADVPALHVLSAAVAGLGGRLFEELRSRRSLAYTVTTAPVARWLGGAVIAYIGTAPEREAEAREALLHELVRLGGELLPADDVRRAQRYLIGVWQIAQQTHSRQLADLAHALLLGEGLDELRHYEARIRAVDAEHIRAAAERWITPQRMVEGVVRGSGAKPAVHT